jgi:hypothetical protein
MRARLGSSAVGAGVSISVGPVHAAAAGFLAGTTELPTLLCEGRIAALVGEEAGFAGAGFSV